MKDLLDKIKEYSDVHVNWRYELCTRRYSRMSNKKLFYLTYPNRKEYLRLKEERKEKCNTASIPAIMKRHKCDEDRAKEIQKERYTSNTIPAIMKRHKCDEDRAKEIQKERSEKGKKTLNNKPQAEIDKINASKSCSLPLMIERYGEEEGKIRYERRIQLFKNTVKDKPVDREKHYWTPEYHAKKHKVSIEDGEKILQEVFSRRKNFSLQYCINKYGFSEGLIVFNKRQKKWQKTLNNKPQAEIDKINASKSCSLPLMIERYGEEEGKIRYEKWVTSVTKSVPFGMASKESLVFFRKLYKKLRKLNIIASRDCINIGLEKSNELFLYNKTNSKLYFYDFAIRSLNIIVEYHGSTWHPPKHLNNEELTTWFIPGTDINGHEKRRLDEVKIETARSLGYEVYEVYDYEATDKKIEELVNEIEKSKNDNERIIQCSF